MDSAVDMADSSRALDLARIRFQLMSVGPSYAKAQLSISKIVILHAL